MTDDRLESLLRASRAHRGGPPGDALARASQEFLGAGDPSLLGGAAAALADLPAGGAAWVAVVCGAAVERGASAELAGPAILDLLRAWTARLDGGAGAASPERGAIVDAFNQLCQAAVCHLAGMPARREAMAGDELLLARLEALEDLDGCSHGAMWIRSALMRASGALVVLHPPSATGFKLRYTNVAWCFHLFSLIQTALGERVPGGRRPDPLVARAARGDSDEDVHDTAWWHYGAPGSPTPEIAASIWGESSVRTIPVVDGVQVILLWPPILGSRGWNGGFFGPHLEALPADLVVEQELPRAECNAWLERLGVTGDRGR
jgi:hypothetical protein